QVSGGLTTDCKLDRNFSAVGLLPNAAALHPSLENGVPFATSKQLLGSVTADYNINDNWTLTSVTRLYRVQEKSVDSFTFVTGPAVSATDNIVNRQWTQEVRLASSYDGPFNFLLGAFYQDSEFRIRQVVPLVLSATPSLTPFTDYTQDTNAWSVF